MTDQELRDMLALSAVGALNEEEQMELDVALGDRPDLRAELDGLHGAAAVMADAIAETPPPALRTSVMAAIAATPQVAPDTPADAPLAPVVPIGRRRNRWFAVGAAAAAVVVLAVGALIILPGDDDSGDQIAAVVDADDAVPIPMPGELPGLTIVHSAEEDAAVLLADEVPLPEGDNVYELWAIRDGTPERFATFRPDADGRLSVYAAGLDPASAELWAITEEPAGGSDVPTMPLLNTTA